MSAVALIAVYAVSGIATLWAADRCVTPIRAPLRWALLLLPLLLVGRALLTGSYYGPANIAYASAPLAARSGELPLRGYDNFALSDVAIQIVPWRQAVRESFRSGRFPLWNPYILSGDILLGASQPAVFHPTTLLGLLLPLPTAWTFACAFTFFLAALAAFLFLKEIGLSDGAAFFGASAWMLSHGLAIKVGWPLSQVFSVLPFLYLGLHRLARRLPHGLTCTLVALLLMVMGGHGETLLFAVTGAGIWFLFQLPASPRPLRAVLASFAAGALALALSAPVLLPFLDALPQTAEIAFREATFAKAEKSVPVSTSLAQMMALVYPMAYRGVPAETIPTPPSFHALAHGYVGTLPLALAGIGLFARCRAKWGLLAAGVLTLLPAAAFPVATDFITSLPYYRIAINDYFVFVSMLSIVGLAAIGLDAACQGRVRGATLLFSVVFCAIVIGALEWRGRLLEAGIRPAAQDTATLWTFAGLLPVGALLGFGRIRGHWLSSCALASLLIVRLLEAPKLYPTFESRLFYPPIDEIRRLPAAGKPYRVVGHGYSLVPNQSTFYGLEDPRGYEAMTNARYFETYPLWSIHQPVWFNRVDDLTTPFLAFLNVRFALAEPTARTPPGWVEFVRGRHCVIFENPAALPRAFVPRRVRFVTDGRATVEQMKSCPDFAALGWIEDRGRIPGETENGPAHVRVQAASSGLRLRVDAARPSWVITSVTAWKGWKAYAGNEALPLFFANHAFVGFRVPAGVSDIRMVYWPTAFSVGLWIAGATVVAAAAILPFRHRRRREQGR